MTQSQAMEILKSSGNVFLTGGPGSGKSYLTNQFIEWLLNNGQTPAITASTGIAALQLNGRTLHSWAGVRNDNELTGQDMIDICSNFFVQRSINSTDVLIIDEISMVSPKLLEIVSAIAMKIRGVNAPFGGIRVIAVGDFFQLPPVWKGDNPPYAFESPVWERMQFTTCYLTEQHRTNDNEFTGILRGIRTGTLTHEQKQVIKSRVIDDASGIDAIRLDTHNDKVDKINEQKLFMHEGAPMTYVMQEHGNMKLIPMIKNSCQSPERLTLKVGVKVMFTKNDVDFRWVNGTRGTVVEMDADKVMVETETGIHEVLPVSWDFSEGYGKNKTTKAGIIQMPLRLAYAITIHKSQGMTLDSAIIDCTRAFACGHGYVSISRVRSLDGLHFQGKLTMGTFKIDERVRAFDASLPR
jgi:ATP-dependent DNA helicase PIF1